jgi:hypothetical protein
MADWIVTRPLKYVGEADQIAIDVRARIYERISNTRLRGEMNYGVELFDSKNVCDLPRIGQFPSHQPKERMLGETLESRLLQSDIIVRIEVVESDDFISTFEELP